MKKPTEVIIDLDRKLFFVDGETHRLTKKPRLLVEYLASNPEFVRSWDQIAEVVGSDNVMPQSVTTLVKWARKVVGNRIKCAFAEGYYWKGQVKFIGGERDAGER